ncbi:hypothetical protein [Saccharothrix sp. ALI-22-I]|uniref:hypothetical protein n=1 Tax=Saccharothrix sp. ALI-22-I TaxID=1933778 RepID=UPI00193114EF|nr:hypothetical protein [Saccharothrix sp. ALI-22-I]
MDEGCSRSVATTDLNTLRSPRSVRDGIARGEFRDVGDVHLAVELLSGVMRASAERIGRDPAAFAATVRAAREIVLASLARRPGQGPSTGLQHARHTAME